MMEQGIYIDAIYQHYKGNFYKVKDIAYHAGLSAPIVIYHRCDENGVFKSIRLNKDGKEIIVKQPFYRDLEEFVSNVLGCYPDNLIVPRFKLFKHPTI